MILPKNVLKEFAVFLSGEIKDFYLSEEGKEYYREWLKREEDKEGKKKIWERKNAGKLIWVYRQFSFSGFTESKKYV